MQNPILKLTALAGVIGVGFLVVWQAQKSMSRPNPDVNAKEVFQEFADDGTKPDDNDAPPPDQNEPAGANGSNASRDKTAASPTASEFAQSDAPSQPGLSFGDDSNPRGSDPFASKSDPKSATAAKDSHSTDAGNPFARSDELKTPADATSKSAELFDPFAADANQQHVQAKNAKDEKSPAPETAVQPAGFDAPPPDGATSAGKPEKSEIATSPDEGKANKSGGPQLVSPIPDSEPGSATTAAKDHPEIFPGDAAHELKPVPQKRIQTAASTNDSESLDNVNADSAGSKDAPGKTIDAPLLLDDEKKEDLEKKEPPALKNEPQSKAADSPNSIDAPSLSDVPAKTEDPAASQKDLSTPKLEPQPDAFPAGDSTKSKVTSPESTDGSQGLSFGDDASTKPAKSHDGAEPPLPDPTSADPFGPDTKQPPASDKKPQDEAATTPSPNDVPPAQSGKELVAPAEPGRLGDRIDLSEPAPVKTPNAAPVPAEPPARKNGQSDAPAKSKTNARLKSQPAKNLPMIRPRNFKKGSTQSPETAENVPDSPAENPQPAAETDREAPESPAAAPSRDLFVGDGTVHDNSPQGPQQPRLVLIKSAPPNAVIGQPLIYSILVKNAGESAAHDVVVQDRIPRGTQLKGTIPQAELIDKRLVWKLGTLNPGSQKKISIRVVPTDEGVIGSVATVTFAAEISSKTVITAAKITIGMSAPPRASVGENVTIRFKLSNHGSAHARNVVLRNILPDGLKHAAGKELEFAVGNLSAGESRDVDLTLTAAESGEMINRAVVTTADGASAEAKASITIEESQLVLSRTGPKQRYVGRDAAYTNTVTNRSRTPIAGITVVETVPQGMEFVEASDGGQYDSAKRTIAWHIRELPPGANQDVRVKLISRDAGKMASNVVAFDHKGNKVETASETNVSGFATISLEVPEVPGAVEIGETVTLKIVVGNRGTTQATNVALQVILPDELELASIHGPVKYQQAGSRLDFSPVATVDANSPATFEVAVKARRSGDARLTLRVEADQLSKPLTRDEAILVLGEGK